MRGSLGSMAMAPTTVVGVLVTTTGSTAPPTPSAISARGVDWLSASLKVMSNARGVGATLYGAGSTPVGGVGVNGNDGHTQPAVPGGAAVTTGTRSTDTRPATG